MRQYCTFDAQPNDCDLSAATGMHLISDLSDYKLAGHRKAGDSRFAEGPVFRRLDAIYNYARVMREEADRGEGA